MFVGTDAWLQFAERWTACWEGWGLTALPAGVAMAAVAVKVRVLSLQMTSICRNAKRRCQPSSWYPAGNFPRQLTAGGEESLNSMSCNERRSSCEPSTKTHTASGCLNKIWHMPHSLMPAHDKWSGNLITHAALRSLMHTFKCVYMQQRCFITATFKTEIALFVSLLTFSWCEETHLLTSYTGCCVPEIDTAISPLVFGNAWAVTWNFKCDLINCNSYLMG